ncbi:MAG: anaerobic ribonucleoside-triphosphate reductase activating protein [bacterium]
MKISGIHKLSLIDYPGKLACVVFTEGCNFRCGFCHNPELVFVDERINGSFSSFEGGADFFEFLESRRGFLEGVCITGGEPLLQKDLEEFISKIKEKGFLVKLDTNGYLADRLEKVIKKDLVDYVAMDIKMSMDDKTNADICFPFCQCKMENYKNKYSYVAGVEIDIEKIKKSIKLIMESDIDYEFRTTVVFDLHKKNDILDIARYIRGAKKYVLQKFEIRDKILDDKFLNAKSIKMSEAEEWKKKCEEFAVKCELRGW